jgi:thermopsin
MNRKLINTIVILVIGIFLISTFAGAFASASPSSEKKIANEIKGPEILPGIKNSEKLPLEKRIYQLFKQDNVPMKYAFLPNLQKRFIYTGDQVTPLYSQAPAPMGLGDFGLRMNSTGVLVPYTYTTSSFEGSIQVNSLMDFYMLDSAPYSITFQLNTVLNNVTLFGNSSYVFWNQNVIFYSARTQELTFLDNIWNFSSSAFYMSPNSIYSGYGILVPGVYYYAIGPTIKVTYPFSVDLYLNSTVINGDTAVFFNYTVTFSNGTSISGSYDRVLFNSTYGMPTGYVAPQPYYLVSGSELTPNGYLLNDAEIMIGGPGGGSTAMIYDINAMMNLYYLNSTTKSYHNVPAAFDFGTDTGETSEGVAVSWTGETAMLNAGPSFLYGMWNVSKTNKMSSFIGNVNPPNTFMFVSPGSFFNRAYSAWVPLSPTGEFYYTLPEGNYSAYLLLSNYNPIVINKMNSTLNVSLSRNMSLGIYTPLYAFGNNQLQFISYQGNGSASNPYMIFNNEYCPINPIFAQFNDYAFPTFAGVLIANTNLHINLEAMPMLEMIYPQTLNAFLSYYNLPKTNYLNYEFYNTSNLSLINTQFISGWFPYAAVYWNPLVASVIFWNSTHNLIANNQFSSMGSSLLFYNNNATYSNNVIWGNYFFENSITQSYFASSLYNGLMPFGLTLYSGNNLIYNNYFDVQYPAYNPDYNAYWAVPALYLNIWNISMEPLNYTYHFNGFSLTGNILGVGYQGGNFWYNLNNKSFFNDLGLIESGGDYLPLDFMQIQLMFKETGLPTGTAWYVELLSTVNYLVENFSSSSNNVTFYVLPGTYYALVGSVSGYIQNVSFIKLSVLAPTTVNVAYTKLYNVTFNETGLPLGTPWSVSLNGSVETSNTNSITFSVTPGNYTYHVLEVQGYRSIPTGGTISVTNKSVTQKITFTQVLYNVTFTEKGLLSGTWGISINNITKNALAGKNIIFNLPNGTYAFTVLQVPGYTSNIMSGYIYVNNGLISEQITYSQIMVNAEFTETGLPLGTPWSVQVNGQMFTTTGTLIPVSLPFGTYSYKVITPGYIATPGSGIFTINGTEVKINIAFVPAKYAVTFIETGLPSGISWKMNFDGTNYIINTSSLSFSLMNGTYPFVIYAIPGYNITPSSGSIVVNGNIITEEITFTPLNYTITFVETGLPPGSIWSVTLNGQTKSSSSSTIVFVEHYGTYSYKITYPSGYTSSITSGNITAGMVTVSPVISLTTYYTGITPLNITLIIIVVILVIVAIVEIIYFRRKKTKEGVKPSTETKEENKEEKQ